MADQLPPLTIYSTRVAPKGVIEFLRSTGLPLEVEGPEDDWTLATITVKKKGWLSSAQTLVISHSSNYYDGEDWPRQRFGLQNYLAAFPETPNRPDVLRLVSSFQFALAIPRENWDDSNNYQRWKMVYRLCEYLDAVFLTPVALYDANGLLLTSRNGQFDPKAKLPKIPEFVSSSDQADDEAGEQQVNPPSAKRVARRTVALSIAAARSFQEIDTLEDSEEDRKYLLELIKILKLEDELEPQEWKVLQRPVGKLEEQDHINAIWRIEGAATLAWALNWFPLPPDDELVNVQEFFEALKLGEPDALNQMIDEATLRPLDEINDMRIHLTMLHWRLRNYKLRPEPMDFAKFSESCWIGTFDISKFRLIDNDLAIGDVSIHNAATEECSRVNSLAMERHLAINWITGGSDIYSETDTST